MKVLDQREVNFDLRPDAQGFDEIRIVTVPRYKESELSGDEWRISASIEFYRKGILVHTGGGTRNVETACMVLGHHFLLAGDEGNAYFAGDGIHCDQEGCPKAATVRYRKLANYSRDGHKSEPHRPTYRHFCDQHKTRGDCGLDDADRNYEVVL